MDKKDIILIIGSYYDDGDEQYAIDNYYKNSICVANEQYEKKLFKGFLTLKKRVYFLSCPRVGSFPFSSKKIYVKGFTENKNILSVNYCCLYGFLNLFKKYSLIKKIKALLKTITAEETIHIICTEAHHPYLSALRYIKKKHKNSFSTLIVPDLPQDMLKNKKILYRILKFLDIKAINRLINQTVDSFLCFTKAINDAINIQKKPYIIREGIIDKNDLSFKKTSPIFKCTYIGKTDSRNGIQILLDSSAYLPPNISIEIYGSGNMDKELKKLKSSNVKFHGFIRHSKIDHILSESDVLLSPRLPGEDYTNYSFPSKIFEYLSFYKNIVTFKLPCYFKELDKVLFYPEEVSGKSFAQCILKALNNTRNNLDIIDGILEKYVSTNIAQEIIDLRF